MTHFNDLHTVTIVLYLFTCIYSILYIFMAWYTLGPQLSHTIGSSRPTVPSVYTENGRQGFQQLQTASNYPFYKQIPG